MRYFYVVCNVDINIVLFIIARLLLPISVLSDAGTFIQMSLKWNKDIMHPF